MVQFEPAQDAVASGRLQTFAQPPQLFGSVAVLTQVPFVVVVQSVSPVGQVSLQTGVSGAVAAGHVAVPPVGVGQAAHVSPHDVSEVELFAMHVVFVPLVHAWSFAGHAHFEFWHVIPPLHALPHAPQLFESVTVLTSQPLAALLSQLA
jgi:hypothetical protein